MLPADLLIINNYSKNPLEIPKGTNANANYLMSLGLHIEWLYSLWICE